MKALYFVILSLLLTTNCFATDLFKGKQLGSPLFNSSIFSHVVTDNTGAQAFSAIFDGAAVAMDGTNTTDNATKFNGLVTAAVTAGSSFIHIPCGTYLFNSAISIAIPSGKRLTIRGDGSYCTKLLFHAANGFTETLGNGLSSNEISGLSLVTDGTTFNALTVTDSTGSNSSEPTSLYQDLVFIGADNNGSTGSDYWASGAAWTGVSNVMVLGGQCAGRPNTYTGGTCYSYTGITGSGNQSVWFTMIGTEAEACTVAMNVGSFVEGVVLQNINFTACASGVVTSSSINDEDWIGIYNSQIEADVCGVCSNNPQLSNLTVNDSIFIVDAGCGINISGVGFNITNNVISANGVGAGNAMCFPIGTYATGGIVQNNLCGEVLYCVYLPDSTFDYVIARNNTDKNSSSGAKYKRGSGVTGQFMILDNEPTTFAALPLCDLTTVYSQLFVIDATASTAYYGAVSAGGSSQHSTLMCDTANWRVN